MEVVAPSVSVQELARTDHVATLVASFNVVSSVNVESIRKAGFHNIARIHQKRSILIKFLLIKASPSQFQIRSYLVLLLQFSGFCSHLRACFISSRRDHCIVIYWTFFSTFSLYVFLDR